MTPPSVKQRIERHLSAALSPEELVVVDESDRHIGHAGHDGRGESHFAVRIVSAAFEGKSRIERQRDVYAALGDLMQGRIHALSIEAKTPAET